jgi:hypothetical protein
MPRGSEGPERIQANSGAKVRSPFAPRAAAYTAHSAPLSPARNGGWRRRCSCACSENAAGHSQSLETVKDFVEERPRRFVDAGRLTFAWSRYADDAIRLCGTAKAGSGAVDIFRPRDIEINDGTSQFMRVKNGALCAFRTQASIVEQNNQHIAIAHIPFGALKRIS